MSLFKSLFGRREDDYTAWNIGHSVGKTFITGDPGTHRHYIRMHADGETTYSGIPSKDNMRVKQIAGLDSNGIRALREAYQDCRVHSEQPAENPSFYGLMRKYAKKPAEGLHLAIGLGHDWEPDHIVLTEPVERIE